MDWSEKSNVKEEMVNYIADFVVDSNFGVPGAITVMNKNHKEFFVVSITIEGFACGPIHFPCNSWVQSHKYLPGKRIFFSNQVHLIKLIVLINTKIVAFSEVSLFSLFLIPHYVHYLNY